MTIEITPSGTRGARGANPPRFLLKPFRFINVAFYRLFGNRLRLMGARMLLLTTVGARTGQARQSTLCGFDDAGGAWLVVASSGGAAKHPAWYFNMAKHPDEVTIEIGGQRLKVRPESLKGAERDQAWQRILSQSPGYATYQQHTDREIPIVRLTQVS